MRKWTYLVAALLMAGATTTFTGCIDNDEPEGITNLRGAKAELIKAQAAVELVEVEMKKALVAQQELVNKAKELANSRYEIETELSKLAVELKKLEVERAQASTEQHKAECDAKIAEANKNKAFWENKQAIEAETFKKDMIEAQEKTAKAQETYDNAIKLIEAGKLLLSDGEKAIINKAQLHLESAAGAMNSKFDELKNAQNAYNDALTDKTTPTLSSLEAKLATLKVKVETQEIIVKEQERLLGLASDFDAVAWDKEVNKLKEKMQLAGVSRDSSEVEKVTFMEKADWKAAVKKEADATKALGTKSDATDKKIEGTNTLTAWAAYNKVKKDSTDAFSGIKVGEVATMLNIKKFEKDPINKALIEFFSKPGSGFESLVGYTNGVFSYAKGTYTQGKYVADLKSIATDGKDAILTSAAAMNVKTVEDWVSTLGKYSVDGNGVEWAKVELKKAEEVAKTAATENDKKKAAWGITVKAVQGTSTAVPTADFTATIKAYNDAYAALDKAVTAYNKAYDEVYTAAYDKYMQEEQSKKFDEYFRQRGIPQLATADKAIWDGLTQAQQTTAKLKELLGTTLTASTTTDANKDTNNFYFNADGTHKSTYTSLIANAKIAGTTAINADLALGGKGKLAPATEALTKANAATTTAEDKLSIGYTAFEKLSKDFYGQKPTDKAIVIVDAIGKTTDAFYVQELDDTSAPTGHYVMSDKRSDVTADESGKLTLTALDEATAIKALKERSAEAFGSTIYDWNSVSDETRLLEVTEAMVRADAKKNNIVINSTNYGTLGELIASTDKVQLCKDMIGAADLITPLKAEMDKVLADLKAEIEANTAKITPFVIAAQEAYAAVGTAQIALQTATDEKAALIAPYDAAIIKFTTLYGSLDTILKDLEGQIKEMYPGIIVSGAPAPTPTYTAEAYVNFWKEKVTTAKETLESLKKDVISQEKIIDLFNKGEYDHAYVIEQRRIALEAATEVFNAAKAVYDSALADVKKVLETLTK